MHSVLLNGTKVCPIYPTCKSINNDFTCVPINQDFSKKDNLGRTAIKALSGND
jgi:hypothetical protein